MGEIKERKQYSYFIAVPQLHANVVKCEYASSTRPRRLL